LTSQPARSETARSSHHLAHVDGLRAVAVLSVLAYHLGGNWLQGGFLGVDVFFVISGFVVTAALAGHRSETLGKFLGGFYHRRLTRILPALLVVLLVTTFAWTLLIPRSWLSTHIEQVALAAYFGLSNWVLGGQTETYFAPTTEFNAFTHTWSLGVEEQFYLVAPWLVFLALRRRTAGLGLLAITAAAALAWAAWATSRVPTQAFYGIAARFWELAAGVLWFLGAWQRPTPAWLGRLFTPLQPLGWVILAGSLALASAQGVPFPWPLAAATGTLLLIGLPSTVGAWTVRPLGQSVVQWIGLRSYSLYLWHWPIYVLMRWTVGLERGWSGAVALAAAFMAAAASYRWVESPLRRSTRWNAWPAARTCGVLVGVAAIAAVASQQAFQNRWHWVQTTVERHAHDWYAMERDPTLALPAGCKDGAPVHTRMIGPQAVIEYASCAGSRDAAPLRLFILGDSHAASYAPLAHRLSVEHSVAVSVVQYAGCPLLDMNTRVGEGREPGCAQRWHTILADLMGTARPGDVVFLSSLRLPRFGDQWGMHEDERVIEQHFSALAATLRHGAVAESGDWLQPLLARGLRVILEDPKPIFRAPAFRCADPWTRGNPVCARGLVETREFEDRLREPVRKALRAAVAAQGPAALTIFDPLPALCDDRACRAIATDGRPLFFDADHLTRYGNERIATSFVEHLRGIGALRRDLSIVDGS